MAVGLNFYTIWDWTATKQATRQSIIPDSRPAAAVLRLAGLRATSDNSPQKLQHWTIGPSCVVGVSKTCSLSFICGAFLPLLAVLRSSRTQSARLWFQRASACWDPSSLTLKSMNRLKVDWSRETRTNRLPHSRRTDLPPPLPPVCSSSVLRHRFSEGTSITTLRPPAPSPLQLKPSTCAFTPKSAGGTAPCAWSCSAASCQVRAGHCPGVCTKQR